MLSSFFIALIGVAMIAFVAGSRRAVALAGPQISTLHSRPSYHGGYALILAAGPALILLILWLLLGGRILDMMVAARFDEVLSGLSMPQREAFMRDARQLAEGSIYGTPTPQTEAAAEVYRSLAATAEIILGIVLTMLAGAGFLLAWRTISLRKRTRQFVERTIMVVLIACSVVAILTTIGIVLSLIFESLRFFQKVPLFDFLFGLHWSPQSAFVGAGAEARTNPDVFGAVPLFAGTLLITAIAMLVAAPVGLMSAIYLSDYASKQFRAVAKPVLEVLAGIPTVVYGFFAALTVAPFIRRSGESIGLSVSSESALAAGVVMGIMIIPFVSSLSDDVINAVPQSLRDGSAGLGATKAETIRRVVMPAALPGIVSALLLAVSRAVGETMIVVMAAGLGANLTANPLEAVTTVTVQIVTLLVGDQEFDSAKTLAAFALGLVLFCVTLTLNVVALRVVQKYRERYD
ncbi:phosphate ABC transporter permease subunit PstC [Afifella pfennigii]|uniref:phosphate ABC transporter permease subunit PstC n=1 Tax=Afifella pfennigii TaxID=209897 RepID=UPI00047BD108|nr:phosphate ABC transporter permease subunit PstC [Afifella pfennigii]